MPRTQAEIEIRKRFSSRTGRVLKNGATFRIPKKYKDDGSVVTAQTFDARKDYKKLNLNDWAFLQVWQRNDYNEEKTRLELNLPDYDVKKLVKKLDAFKTEDIKDRALAQVPSTAFVQARHVENVLGGEPLDDSKRDSLKELAKINGSYKTNLQVNVQQNFFQMPKMTPEQEQAASVFFDTLAIEESHAA